MTSFGVRSTFRSDAARRIEAAGRAYQERLARESAPNGGAAPASPAAGSPAPSHAAAAKPGSPGQCHRIIEEVSRKHDIPVKDILSERRARVLIPARHEAIFRCVAESPLSLPAIGRIFNRDHTSIGHAVMRHHLNTGAPLPRGMDWQAGRRKRRPDKASRNGAEQAECPPVGHRERALTEA